MEQIRRNIRQYIDSLPEGVSLVAVSKFHPVKAIQAAYDEGQRIFGESRANEFVAKAKALPKDIQWHFIGHLQTNKVRQIIPYTMLIHSVDSERLLVAIDAEAQHIGRTVDALLQLHVAQEETKFGFSPEELIELAKSSKFEQLKNVRIRGVMGMASNTDDTIRIEKDLKAIHDTFLQLKQLSNFDYEAFNFFSKGILDVYLLVINEGIKKWLIGASIFGNRQN